MNKILIILGLIVVLGLGYFLLKDSGSPQAISYTSEVATFSSDSGQFTVQYSDDSEYAQLSLSGVQYPLSRARSASGAKYTNDDESVVFWEHQGEASVEIDGEKIFDSAKVADNMDGNILTFNVGPEKKECVGVAPMECLVVNDEYFYDTIEGFEYEAGFNYELQVERTERENVPADASQYTYRLVEEVSKTPVSVDSSLTDTAWLWTKTQYSNDETVIPNDTDAFVLSFASDGRFSATTDCNNVMGSYTVEQSSLVFGQMASTKKACLGDSQENEFTGALGQVESYLVDNQEDITLKLTGPKSTMTFIKVE